MSVIILQKKTVTPKKRKPPNDYEHQDQAALFNWAELDRKKYPEIALMFAIQNARKCPPRMGKYLNDEGRKAGIPDICLPVSRHGFHALYIELKTTSGRMQQNQIEWQQELNKAGNLAVTCYGWTHARDSIIEYLKG